MRFSNPALQHSTTRVLEEKSFQDAKPDYLYLLKIIRVKVSFLYVTIGSNTIELINLENKLNRNISYKKLLFFPNKLTWFSFLKLDFPKVGRFTLAAFLLAILRSKSGPKRDISSPGPASKVLLASSVDRVLPPDLVTGLRTTPHGVLAARGAGIGPLFRAFFTAPPRGSTEAGSWGLFSLVYIVTDSSSGQVTRSPGGDGSIFELSNRLAAILSAINVVFVLPISDSVGAHAPCLETPHHLMLSAFGKPTAPF